MAQSPRFEYFNIHSQFDNIHHLTISVDDHGCASKSLLVLFKLVVARQNPLDYLSLVYDLNMIELWFYGSVIQLDRCPLLKRFKVCLSRWASRTSQQRSKRIRYWQSDSRCEIHDKYLEFMKELDVSNKAGGRMTGTGVYGLDLELSEEA